MSFKSPFLIMCLTLFLVGCGNNAAVTTATPPPTATESFDQTQDEPASAPPATLTPTEIPPITEPPLPPDPQRIEFQTEDDVTLVGYYYPASVNPAPVVVLMHWAGGDQTDWLYVGMVSWLQNRSMEIPSAPEGKYFDTPYPFPTLPDDLSYGVFTFDFRGYGESAGSGGQEEHILDARAAYVTAAGLDGVDAVRVAGIGASIGADGVVDGCDETCTGALSLGPGNWLTMPYSEAVKDMDDMGKPAWCVATEDSAPGPDLQTCNSAAGDHYVKQIYPNGGHAMTLFRAELNLTPPIETLILDFLNAAFAR